MTRAPAIALPLLLSAAAAAPAQDTPDPVYETSLLAWDRGDYIPALEGFARILEARQGERYFERIARLTGELHPTVELARDGRSARFSPDGRWVAFEAGDDGAVVTHLVPIASGTEKAAPARIEGTGLVFAPAGGRAAYVRARGTAEAARARAAVERAVREGDRETIARRRGELAYVMARDARIVVRELASGRERVLEDGGLVKAELAWSADGETLYVAGAKPGETDRSDIYAFGASGPPRKVTGGAGVKGDPIVAPGGRYLLYSVSGRSAAPFAGGAAAGRTGRGASRIVVRDLRTGAERAFDGAGARLSADGSTAVFLAAEGEATLVRVVRLDGGEPVTVKRTELRVAEPALSPDGRIVAFQMMPREDWEVYLVERDGSNERRLTRDVQHDLYPRFISPRTLLVVKGERRHRRSYAYDVETGREVRLFHNNTVRTIAPEYEWDVSPDGTKLVVVAERDGDTVSPERGVYLMDLGRTITKADLVKRIAANLAAERDLRERGRGMFEPIAAEVRLAVAKVSKTKLYEYQRTLHGFDSKHITRPGNRKAREYIFETLESWGYEPEYQWFEPRPGVRTANVIARLRGTTHPELVYVVGSHFDSVERGPGADDNTSGTSVLLETARVLKDSPLPATVVFAFFTGEEAGLLGSREFARRALAEKWNVVGALNNDMMGYANDHRLDNTIRYSNPGIRDVQHAAAFLFSDLITYDARYYKSTDAHALFDAFGDVIGGIGSYPVLANPHYHQAHDVLETIDQDLVRETTKANVASVMLLASSPARLKGLEVVSRRGARVQVEWTPAGEEDVREYVVAWGPAGGAPQRVVRASEPRATLDAVAPGTEIAVKAINARGLVGWDWARLIVP